MGTELNAQIGPTGMCICTTDLTGNVKVEITALAPATPVADYY